jgi:predicted nuclease of predicted toxin-antitoxin system
LKFKLDENMPADLAVLLRHHGHDTTNVAEERLAGANDPPLLAEAVKERRVLLTFDVDFADIRAYPPGTHAGIVVFRLHDQRWKTLARPATHLLDSGDLESLEDGLAIVDETRIRWKRPKKKGKL